jgi:quercetin dioxygenase-like cupin family protein
MRSVRKWTAGITVVMGGALGYGRAISAQTPAAPGTATTPAPTIACVDSSASGVIGGTPCTIFSRRPVEKFPDGPVLWTLETFPSRAAAQQAMSATGAVVDVDGKVWLLTVGPHRPVPPGAVRAAEIGPLPLPPAKSYEMMLAYVAVPPGSQSAVHVQSGPEAWYVLAGSQCVETPSTVQHIAQGSGGIVPADTPLYLIATGTTMRRAFFVIVHDAARPFYTEINSWKPRGACSA